MTKINFKLSLPDRKRRKKIPSRVKTFIWPDQSDNGKNASFLKAKDDQQERHRFSKIQPYSNSRDVEQCSGLKNTVGLAKFLSFNIQP